MNSQVRYIPVWKHNATGTERLQELAQVAAEKPHEFKQVLVIYVEELPNNNTITRTISAGCSTHEALGMLVEAQIEISLESKR